METRQLTRTFTLIPTGSWIHLVHPKSPIQLDTLFHTTQSQGDLASRIQCLSFAVLLRL